MPFPTQNQIKVPLLEVLEKLGGQAEPQQVYPKVAEYFPQLTEEDMKATLPNNPGVNKWWNRVQWTRQSLVDAGYIDGTQRGVWKLTSKGAEWLHQQHGAAIPPEPIKAQPKEHPTDSPVPEAPPPKKTEVKPFTKQDALKDLFMPESQLAEMLDALREKKNVVLQGAPGVGKTFVAKRLAYAMIGSSDPARVEMIQFHQSYSYEDFIQGFRPTPKGHFELKCGLFHDFCLRAKAEEEHDDAYVFIIDEINRGNLSKIFGELMMLIEPDKRGKEYAIPLAYSSEGAEKFYIPENLYFIGTMNTADRSLAMVDYALRRCFRFITLQPEFASKGFRDCLADAGVDADLINKIVSRMGALNEAIAADTKSLGPGYEIGHSYFCPRNGTKPDESWYHRVVESEIVPLIQEYWFDNDQKVKEHRSALLA